MGRGVKLAPQTAPSAARADYRRGTVFALASTALLAAQLPFSALAARSLSATDFLGFSVLQRHGKEFCMSA